MELGGTSDLCVSKLIGKSVGSCANERKQQEREAKSTSKTALHGFDLLLRMLSSLESNEQRNKTELLWEALADIEQCQRSAFTGTQVFPLL